MKEKTEKISTELKNQTLTVDARLPTKIRGI